MGIAGDSEMTEDRGKCPLRDNEAPSLLVAEC